MERRKGAKKGENGKLLIIGGSEDYAGAVALAGLAALRAGCDTVTIAAPTKVAWYINQITPDLITKKIPGQYFAVKHVKELIRLTDHFDAVLLGPGLTRKADRFAAAFVKKCQIPLVVDADALKPMSFKDFTNTLVTPHFTELEMMLTNSKKDFLFPKLKQGNAKEQGDILQGNLRYFLTNKNVLLLKGATDVVISRNRMGFNRTGNPGMAKAGTGDILAGLAAGFLAKTGELYKSAIAAAYINGLMGDLLLKKKKGYSFIASDILEDLGKIKKLRKKK